MKVEIKRGLWGAKKSEGLVVMIDVFRASNTILAMLNSGVKEIIIVEKISHARSLRKRKLNYLLCGERRRIKPKDFDCGNSPVEFMRKEDRGVIFSSSACTRGIANAKKAKEVIIGSFANANAVVRYIRKRKPEKVTLLAIGTEAVRRATEDDLCAEYIAELLEGGKIPFSKIKRQILKSEAVKDLKRLGHEKDIPYCLKLDSSKIVPRVSRTGKYLKIVNKKD